MNATNDQREGYAPRSQLEYEEAKKLEAARKPTQPRQSGAVDQVTFEKVIGSSRTQFMRRLVEFSDRHRLTLELAYYPPYHIKYNLIERCWGILENHWNGALLNTIQTALAWARTMTWRGVAPLVHLLDRVYETGVRLRPDSSAPSPAASNDPSAPQMEPRDSTPTPVGYFTRAA